ncbi:MAG: monovalent cation/H(+) antiporter subunit G [Salinibacter sp.]|uniref:monovalent cation/H(+) antiporter subunit G n=1 Tax=Salinibacter sp. TaxID=2065818 RepID=UPI0035D49F29
MTDILAALLMTGGTFLMLVAAVGLLRFPDLYTRMHAVTKAGTLGIGLMLISAAVAFGDLSVAARALAALLFVFLTAPVSAHMIGRAGYLGDVALWEETAFDDWGAEYEELRREGEEPLTEADVQMRGDSGPSDLAA